MKTRILGMIMGATLFLKGESIARNEDSFVSPSQTASHETSFHADFIKVLSERQKILAILKDRSMQKIIDLQVMARSERILTHWFVSRIDDVPVEIIAGMIPITTSQEPIFIDFKIASDGTHRVIGISLFIAFDEKREYTVPVIIQTFSENEAYNDKQYVEQRKLLGILHPKIGEVISWTAENAEKILRETLVKMEIASDKELARLIPPRSPEKGVEI